MAHPSDKSVVEEIAYAASHLRHIVLTDPARNWQRSKFPTAARIRQT
jgi:hypothetical protein